MAQRDQKAQANRHIFDVLRSWGLKPRLDGDSVICGIGSMKARCVDVEISHGGQVASLIIELVIDPQTNFVLTENVAQIADSPDKAIGGAVYMWAFSVFVAIAALLAPEGCPGHMAGRVEKEFANESGTLYPWNIYSSPLMIIGHGGDEQSEKSQDYRPATLPLFEPLLAEICQVPRVHAIKAFLVDTNGELSGDCAVNGVTSMPAMELLKGFNWSPGSGMRSLRQFHVLAPADFKIDMTVPSLPQKQGWFGKLLGRG